MPSFENTTELDSTIQVYAGLATATAYVDGADHASVFRALIESDEADAERKLVTATRIIDRTKFRGVKVSDSQEHAFPRKNTGLTEMEVTDFPAHVQQAAIELAIALANGSEVQDQRNTNQRIQSLQAGSVSISYFGGQDGLTVQRFPQIVQELLGPYLAGTEGSTSTIGVAGLAAGQCGEKSITRQNFGVTRPL